MLSFLQLSHFRCFEKVRLELEAPTTLLMGHNGQGKTSLIEAACVLLRLQSPRSTARSDWIRFDQDSTVVEGNWNGSDLRYATTAKTRRLAVDGAVCGRSSEYLQSSGILVWMDHGDMGLLRGGAEHRRRYLDFAASQIHPEYLPALRAYEKALRSRNHLLKRDARISWDQVDAYGRVLAEKGRILREARARVCEWVQPHVEEYHRRVSGAEEPVGVSYRSGFEGDDLAEALEASREEESRHRVTRLGIHRDEVELTLHSRDAQAFASEGQQRTIALALKLAQARVLKEQRQMAPLMLMDDVFGELDHRRRQALMECLPRDTQKILTTTHLDWLDETVEGARIWEVCEGGVRPRD